MFAPYKNNKRIDKDYHFKRKIPSGLVVDIEKGQEVKSDTVIASGKVFTEKENIDISSTLRVKPFAACKHIKCLNGERVQKGDRLAYKRGGVTGRERLVTAPSSGLVDLTEIDAGIIKILGVAKETTVNAGVEGKVVSVIKDKQVNILTSVLKVLPFKIYGGEVQGVLFYLDSKSEEGGDLNDSIVTIDFEADRKYLRNLALSGVQGVIMGGVDDSLLAGISDDGLWGMTLCILEGYGNIRMNKKLASACLDNDGSLCFIDNKKNELVLTNISKRIKFKEGFFIKRFDIGDRVQAFEIDNWGVYGKVIDISSDFVRLEIESKEQGQIVEVHRNNLLIC